MALKHFKKTIIVCLVVFTVLCCVSAEAAGEVNPDPYQRVVITTLYRDIQKAIQEHYGETIRGYDLYDAKIRKLESLRGWSDFNVTVDVETFYGPHNPPYGLERMTFYISLGEEPKLIKYEHKNIE